MNKKEIMQAFLNNEAGERVPVGFWHHFVSFHNHYHADVPEVYEAILSGQKKYIDVVQPDFLKIMSDGFFGHPSVCSKKIESIEDLAQVRSVGANHDWIDRQVAYVKEICEYAGEDIVKYYSIFSPLQYIRLRFEEYDEDFQKFVALFKQDKDVMIRAAEYIAEDIKQLITRLFEETKLDGIYYSVQCVQDRDFTDAVHKELVEPTDMLIIDRIRQFTDNIMLHICGYGHYTNTLSRYKDYPVKAYNWAVHTEKVSLAEGKKLFGGKAVLGGFDNNLGTILYEGSKEELRAEVHKILDEAGCCGVGLGADCTIAQDIQPERLAWIREIASAYSQ